MAHRWWWGISHSVRPNHWRGKFFGRQGCTGQSGSTFKCAVGDCGPYADRCSLGEQPTSLAEFNFDQNDGLAPWYNVSYVNAFSVPITIRANNAQAPPGSRECETMRCPKAYAWSKQDAEQGNQTVRQCRNCTGFTVTFHAVA